MFFQKRGFIAMGILAFAATAVLAFEAPQTEKAQADLYWFEVNETTGMITDVYIGNAPETGCDEPTADILCSAGLDEQDVDLSDPNNPQPQITDPQQAEDQAYRFQ